MVMRRGNKETECGEKFKFSSDTAAKRFLRDKGLREMHTYACRWCRRWHIGH